MVQVPRWACPLRDRLPRLAFQSRKPTLFHSGPRSTLTPSFLWQALYSNPPHPNLSTQWHTPPPLPYPSGRPCQPLYADTYYETSSVKPQPSISYTESYRDLQESYQAIQLCYRTRKFELEYSISAPVRSSVHRNRTYPTLKTFLRFLSYRSFEGVEAPKGC
jgi:hypothetical protein